MPFIGSVWQWSQLKPRWTSLHLSFYSHNMIGSGPRELQFIENLTLYGGWSSSEILGFIVEKYKLQCSFGLFLLFNFFYSFDLYDYFLPNLNSKRYSKNLIILSLPFSFDFPLQTSQFAFNWWVQLWQLNSSLTVSDLKSSEKHLLSRFSTLFYCFIEFFNFTDFLLDNPFSLIVFEELKSMEGLVEVETLRHWFY